MLIFIYCSLYHHYAYVFQNPFSVASLWQNALIELRRKTGNRRKDDLKTSENMNEEMIKFDTLLCQTIPECFDEVRFRSRERDRVNKGYLR